MHHDRHCPLPCSAAGKTHSIYTLHILDNYTRVAQSCASDGMDSLGRAFRPSTIKHTRARAPPASRVAFFTLERAKTRKKKKKRRNHIMHPGRLNELARLASLLSHIFPGLHFHYRRPFFESRNANLPPLPLMNEAKKEGGKKEKKTLCSNSRPLSNSDRELSSFQPIPVQAPWRCQHRIRSCLLFNLLITERGEGWRVGGEECYRAPSVLMLLRGVGLSRRSSRGLRSKHVRRRMPNLFLPPPEFDPIFEE